MNVMGVPVAARTPPWPPTGLVTATRGKRSAIAGPSRAWAIDLADCHPLGFARYRPPQARRQWHYPTCLLLRSEIVASCTGAQAPGGPDRCRSGSPIQTTPAFHFDFI